MLLQPITPAQTPQAKRAEDRVLTIDLARLDDTDALYLIDLISTALNDPDPITDACQTVAFDMAGGVREEPFGPDRFDVADSIYPQTSGALEWDRFARQRDDHLRRFGFLKGGFQ